MAQEFGARLLGEVQECGLDEILKEVRRRKQPEGPQRTGIKYIDDLVEAFASNQLPRPPAQHQASTQSATSFSVTDHKPPVIEVTGASPASGKTQLLYLIASKQLLGQPSSDPSTSAIPPSTVVFFDLSNTFSAHRLRDILKFQLKPLPFTDPSASDPEAAKAAHIHSTAIAALQHIHVFKPQTSTSFIASLQSLRAYLFDLTAHHSAHRRLGAILISDLSAFYWQDRHDGELAALSRLNTQNRASAGRVSNQNKQQASEIITQRWRKIVTSLRELQSTFDCAVVGSNVALLRPQWIPDGLVVQPHLPAVWNGFVNLRIVLERERTRYPATISAEEALREQKWKLKGEGAMEVVSRMRPNMWRADEWEDRFRQGVGEVVRSWKCSLMLGKEVKIKNEER